MINIYVQRTLAKACSDAPITSGSVGLTAQFLFSEEWNELTKKAIFETDNYKEPVDVPASGEVIVPESVLVYPWTRLRVGVRGESEDGYVVIPTVYADCGTISLGANTTPVGTPPTPSQAEYLQAQIDELRESGIGGGTTIELDTTLTQSGKAADAKAVGDALENVGGKAYVQDTEPDQMEVGEFWYNPDEEGGSIPTTLPNPHKLTFSGAVNAEYDGSEAVEVVIPQGGGASKGWRLLADITTAEDLKEIIISEDMDGNPFSLSRVAVRATMKGASGSNANVFFFAGGGGSGKSRTISGTAAQDYQCYAEVDGNGNCFVMDTSPIVNTVSQVYMYAPGSAKGTVDAITSVSFYTYQSIAAGATITVWGC